MNIEEVCEYRMLTAFKSDNCETTFQFQTVVLGLVTLRDVHIKSSLTMIRRCQNMVGYDVWYDVDSIWTMS